jgi:PP-loop superfamily ATP-utilizing enzyme
MMNPSQIERLKKDSKELKHYLYRLELEGKEKLARKVRIKHEFLSSYITDLETA